MDHIIAEAKRLGMKLWILDDARFPTGFANGTVPDNLKKRYLGCHRYDIVGSAEEMGVFQKNIYHSEEKRYVNI